MSAAAAEDPYLEIARIQSQTEAAWGAIHQFLRMILNSDS
jgi:hypothetical protein